MTEEKNTISATRQIEWKIRFVIRFPPYGIPHRALF